MLKDGADMPDWLWTLVKISAYLLVPLAWGLLVEYTFERMRRRGRAKPASVANHASDDRTGDAH